MKQYEITIAVRTPTKLKDVLWAVERMLPFNVSIKSSDVVDERPTNVEHHGGDLDDLDGKEYKDIPERF
tara:strand:+ start:1317 stop:1523 length:207 start_codon:yes stop_codon:yes gene_type:complete